MFRSKVNLIGFNSKFYSTNLTEPWTSNKVRKQFIDYFKERDHEFIKPISVLNNDRNPLLVNAGMNQFKSIFLNDRNHLNNNPYLKELTRVANYQKCVRLSGKHNDFDEVGHDYTHHTFFEMLGNWSFNNNYFKEDTCKYALDLLTIYFGIDKERLIVTYFGGDPSLNLTEDVETKEIWLNLGFSPDKVIPIEGKENFWEMADQGPCGICTELHYVKNVELINRVDVSSMELLKNSVEIWNLVFIQYERKGNELKDLDSRHVDTGMGLERILAILNQTESNFNTDLFLPLIHLIERELNAPKYTNSLTEPLDINYRIVVDHIRAICVLIADKVIPSHSNEGLIIRKLIRRTSDILRNDFNEKNPRRIFRLLIRQVARTLKEAYPELDQNKDSIIRHAFNEISWQLQSTYSTEEFLKQFKLNNQVVDGKTVLKLRKKGALTKEELNRIAKEQGLTVNWNEHDELVNEEIRKSNEVKEKNQQIKSMYKDV